VATYITERGAKALAAELRRLAEVERPKVVSEVADAAAQGDRSENAEYIYGKKRLREIDRRLRFLSRRLDEVRVVRPQDIPTQREKVFFAATVELEDEDGKTLRYHLVGPDEADPGEGRLSYQSPLGRALMGKCIGDVVVFRPPMGEVELEILAVSYGDVHSE
jgi:transcription elongation factor GreB